MRLQLLDPSGDGGVLPLASRYSGSKNGLIVYIRAVRLPTFGRCPQGNIYAPYTEASRSRRGDLIGDQACALIASRKSSSLGIETWHPDMKTIAALFAGLLFALLAAAALAQAVPTDDGISRAPDKPRFEHLLTEIHVQSYIAAIADLERNHTPALSALQARFDASLAIAAPLDPAGYVALNRHTYNDLANIDEKELLDSIYRGAGFATTSNWPELSDRIVSAYLKLQIERGVYEIIASMSETLLARLPEKTAIQIKRLKIMLASADRLTTNIDLEVVRPFLLQLEVAMQDVLPQQH